jgi:two-component system OmpR family sensor kinase
VLDNRLANVRAHTPPGTDAVVRVAASGAEAICEVSDNGPGLTEEHARRVFERFYRADPSRSRTSGGAGLGLSIVAAIVGAHGGTVEARPGPAGGAVFAVRLPLAG